ncbi:MAG: hypothetical protein NPIRA03_39200 [Nitrospirales bacterium]|nr:MAG: hypothetical protein NPIRA03_39200 [Nitrospirales bacterium]
MKIAPAFNLFLFTLFLGTILTTNGCVRVHVHVDVLEDSNLQCSSCPTTSHEPPRQEPDLGPEKKISLKIKKHELVELTEDEALGILEQATKVAKTDGQCNLQLVRDGEGEIENFTWLQDGEKVGVVSSDFDFAIITHLPGVKVVKDVQWCDRPGPWIGCAELPGDALAVEMLREKEGEQKPFYQTLGVLWLHEYGHNKGNYHRLNSTAVMHPQIFSEHSALTSTECGNFKLP